MLRDKAEFYIIFSHAFSNRVSLNFFNLTTLSIIEIFKRVEILKPAAIKHPHITSSFNFTEAVPTFEFFNTKTHFSQYILRFVIKFNLRYKTRNASVQ